MIIDYLVMLICKIGWHFNLLVDQFSDNSFRFIAIVQAVG